MNAIYLRNQRIDYSNCAIGYNLAKVICSAVALPLSRFRRATKDKLVLPSKPPSTALSRYEMALHDS